VDRERPRGMSVEWVRPTGCELSGHRAQEERSTEKRSRGWPTRSVGGRAEEAAGILVEEGGIRSTPPRSLAATDSTEVARLVSALVHSLDNFHCRTATKQGLALTSHPALTSAELRSFWRALAHLSSRVLSSPALGYFVQKVIAQCSAVWGLPLNGGDSDGGKQE
jgi:hypothetical protein